MTTTIGEFVSAVLSRGYTCEGKPLASDADFQRLADTAHENEARISKMGIEIYQLANAQERLTSTINLPFMMDNVRLAREKDAAICIIKEMRELFVGLEDRADFQETVQAIDNYLTGIDPYSGVFEENKAYQSRIVELEAQLRELSKRSLLRVMQDFSESTWCCGWMQGLEQECIKIVNGQTSDYGLLEESYPIYQDLKRELTYLHSLAGGWWIWENGETVFVPDAEISEARKKFNKGGEE